MINRAIPEGEVALFIFLAHWLKIESTHVQIVQVADHSINVQQICLKIVCSGRGR